MNPYHRSIAALKEQECPTCHGLGKCDDADFGDMFYNVWTCTTCEGTGMKRLETKKKEEIITQGEQIEYSTGLRQHLHP